MCSCGMNATSAPRVATTTGEALHGAQYGNAPEYQGQVVRGQSVAAVLVCIVKDLTPYLPVSPDVPGWNLPKRHD